MRFGQLVIGAGNPSINAIKQLPNSSWNNLAKLIVLPSALKGTEGCRRHRRTMKAMKGIKGNEGIEYAKALSFSF